MTTLRLDTLYMGPDAKVSASAYALRFALVSFCHDTFTVLFRRCAFETLVLTLTVMLIRMDVPFVRLPRKKVPFVAPVAIGDDALKIVPLGNRSVTLT